MDCFKALLITRDEATKVQAINVASLSPADLMDGDVDVAIETSTVNYKDGLAITGALPVVRRFPLIPGIDFAGTVTASSNPAFKAGDRVILNGWGVGEVHHGAYSERARVKGDWLIPMPAGMTSVEAMAIGTAGYTAMLSVMALERHGITRERGPIVVTGASGGVGSMSIALLAGLGHVVHAVTGRTGEAAYLKGLGATEIIDRTSLTGPVPALARERWAGGIDAVGGAILANILAATRAEGAVAACGRAAAAELPTRMEPFILRGVALLGINSVYVPKARRIEAWDRLARELDRGKLAAMTTTIGFDDIIPAARDILAGKIRGRVVVKIAG